MFTIQLNVIVNIMDKLILDETLYYLLIISLLSYLVTLFLLIFAYSFTDSFQSAPDPEWLLKKAKYKKNKKEDIVKSLLATMPGIMKGNHDCMNRKTTLSAWGLVFLLISCIITTISMISFLNFSFL